MNLVIDDAVEVKQATKTEEESRRSLGMLLRTALDCHYDAIIWLDTNGFIGQILLKGDNVSLIQSLQG